MEGSGSERKNLGFEFCHISETLQVDTRDRGLPACCYSYRVILFRSFMRPLPWQINVDSFHTTNELNQKDEFAREPRRLCRCDIFFESINTCSWQCLLFIFLRKADSSHRRPQKRRPNTHGPCFSPLRLSCFSLAAPWCNKYKLSLRWHFCQSATVSTGQIE